MRITFATQLTLVRMVALPFVIIAFIYHETRVVFLLFTLAALTDFFDGLVARRWGQQSALGAALDPIADKLLLNTCYFMMTYGAEYYVVKIPAWLTVLILSRDFLILIGALLLTLFSSVRQFRPTFLGKTATALQAITIFLALGYNALEKAPNWLSLFYMATFLVTLTAGLQYAWRGFAWLNQAPHPEGSPPSSGGGSSDS